MPTRIVAIDSFDTPNVVPIKPKKNTVVNPGLPPFPNPGPMNPKSVDRRIGAASLPNINGGIQEVQLLMLTAGPNPLIPVPFTPAGWRADVQPNQAVLNVSQGDGAARQAGYLQRCANQNRPIRIIWQRQIPYPRPYANDLSGFTYPNNVIAKRLRVDARDTFVRVNPGNPANPAYSQNKRYIWCPPGIRSSDVVNGPNALTMTAIGCTCRDMLMRGSTRARYGCKHIIAYNTAQATGNLF